MSSVLQLVQDMSNPMIAFERKGVTSTFPQLKLPHKLLLGINQITSSLTIFSQRLFFQELGTIHVVQIT